MVKTSRGFTLIELLVVISIITILTSIALVGVNEVRKNSRDKQRKADIAQLELALRVFATKDQYKGMIECPRGAKLDSNGFEPWDNDPTSCPDAPVLQAFMNSYFPSGIPEDPINNTNHYYFFDAVHNCDPFGFIPIIFAVNLEKSESNHLDVCPQAGNINNNGGYDNIAGVDSKPYARVLDFISSGQTPST